MRGGYRMGPAAIEDGMSSDGFLDPLAGEVMGETAENLAERYAVTREEQDAFALQSQRRAVGAWDAGRFAEEVVPVDTFDAGRRTVTVERDEHPRPGTSLESLARLEPVFRTPGTVTPGNSSGICDGAAALVVMAEEAARARGVRPLARIVGWASAGVDPHVMGWGVVPATRKLLASLGCGNPTAVAELRPGEVVLDLGSGGGIDVLLSARRVGPAGKAYGLDMTEEMLALGRRNATEAGARNVEFLKGHMEAIPLPAATVDVVISNCVINLSFDKPAVFAETFRVLKPEGRLGVSDIVAEDRLSPADRAERGSYVGCIAGALAKGEYEAQLAEAGFADVSVTFTHQVADGLHSAIIKATRPREAATVLTPARSELPVVGQSGCC
jgi:SAM-dependent methyltransferase